MRKSRIQRPTVAPPSLAAALLPGLALAALLVLPGCDGSEPSPPGGTATFAATPTGAQPNPTGPGTPVIPTPTAGASPMTHTPSNPDIDPGLAPLIQRAIDDLASRLGIAPNEIRAVRGYLVQWPDTSLGCPRPGMVYAQVPQDGAVMILEAGGTTYEYHVGGSTAPFLCETPALPAKSPTIPPPR